MLPYTIDDPLIDPQSGEAAGMVEVSIDFDGEKRWLFFVTPQHLASVGDWVPGTRVRTHVGERHMIVVGELTEAIIDAVLRDLHTQNLLERHTLPLE